MISKPTKEKIIFITIFIPLAVLSWKFTKNGRALIGDGPEYIIAAQSIVEDGDLYLENQANRFLIHEAPQWKGGRKKELNNFPPDPRKIESYFLVNVISTAENRFLPYHTPGLSFLIAPGVALLGNWGAVLTIVSCASLLGVELFRTIGSAKKALLVTLSPPLLYLSLLVFKEIPAALLSIVAYRLITQNKITLTKNKLIVGTLLGILPWLHPKYIIITGVLYMYLLFKTTLKETLLPAIVTALLTASLFITYVVLYGNWQALLSTKGPGLINPLKGLAGIFFDREYGLTLHAPWILYALGNISRIKKDFSSFLIPAVIVTSFFLGIATFGNWHGGVAPAGRLIAPALPFLALFLPKGVEKKNPYSGTLCNTVFIISVFLAVINLSLLKKPGYIKPDGVNETWQKIPSGEKITKLFPRVSNSRGNLNELKDWW